MNIFEETKTKWFRISIVKIIVLRNKSTSGNLIIDYNVYDRTLLSTSAKTAHIDIHIPNFTLSDTVIAAWVSIVNNILITVLVEMS